MDERPDHGDHGAGAGAPAPEAPRTGVAAVDAVLDDLATLEELPVAEHAAVFEQAHARLRRALDESSAPVPMPRPDLSRSDAPRPGPGGRDA